MKMHHTYTKKFISILMILTILLSTSPVWASSSTFIEDNDMYSARIIHQKDNYQKLEIFDKQNNSKQFIEYRVVAGIKEYRVLDDKGSTLKSSIVDDRQITFLSAEKTEVARFNRLQEDIRLDFSENSISSSNWVKKYSSGYLHTLFNNITDIIWILCTAAGAPPSVGSAFDIANLILKRVISNVYYSGWHRSRWEYAIYYYECSYNYYKGPGATGYLGNIYWYDFH